MMSTDELTNLADYETLVYDLVIIVSQGGQRKQCREIGLDVKPKN